MQANKPSKQRSVRMGASVVRRVGFPARRGNNAITSFSLSPRTACWPTFVPRALIGYSVLRQFSKISEWPKWLCNCQMQKIHLTSNSISHFGAEGKKGYKLCKETRASENNGITDARKTLMDDLNLKAFANYQFCSEWLYGVTFVWCLKSVKMCGIFDRTNQTSPGTCYRSCPWSNEFFWSLVFLSRGMFAFSSLYVVAFFSHWQNSW